MEAFQNLSKASLSKYIVLLHVVYLIELSVLVLQYKVTPVNFDVLELLQGLNLLDRHETLTKYSILI